MIRSIVQSSLRLRPLIIGAVAVLMFFGATRLGNMPVDVFPEIMPVTVNVQTEALGLSAAEVEQLITVPMEADLLSGTPWVDVMRSESVPGLSSVELTFKPGTDPLAARQVVQERLTQAHVALPNVSKSPQMVQPLSATNRIMLVSVSSKTKSMIETSVLARWTIRPRLLSVPGVANVSIWGQRERQLQVQVDPEKLRAKDVSLLDVIKTAGNALWFSPLSFLESSVAGTGGFVETPNQRIGVRHILPINTAKDLASIPIEGTSMRLDQVATVTEDHQPLIGDAMNGQGLGLLLVIEKLPGVNTVKVSDDILAALETLKPGLPGIVFDSEVYRPATYIRSSAQNVGVALLIAILLAAVALLIMTYSWRAAVVGLVAIVTSLMAAIVTLYLFGNSMNVMVLAGLAIGLGIIIDDAIIDPDHFLRRRKCSTDASCARVIVDAWSRLRKPLMFATAIGLLAVVPLLFMKGGAGAFLKPLVLSYTVAMLASLVVASVVTPVMTFLLLHRQTAPGDSPFAAWLKGLYDRLSPRAVTAPRVALAATIVIALVSAAMFPRLHPQTAPRFLERDLMVHWDAIPGTSRAEMNRIIERASKELRSIGGVRDVGSHVGRAVLSDQVVGMNSSELWVSLDPKADYDATVASIEEAVSGYPGIDADVTTYLRSRFNETLSGVDEPIVVRVYGLERAALQREAEKVRASIAGIPGISEPRVEFEAEEPIVEVEVDLAAAQAHGIKPGDVRRAAATLLAGVEVGNLFEEQKLFQVVVWGEPHVRHSLAAISNLVIDGPEGQVRLGDVAKVKIVAAPQVIRRENVSRRLDVIANVSGRGVDAVTADVRKSVGGMTFPLEYRAEVIGAYAEQQAGRNRVLVVAGGAVLGILVLLHAATGSWILSLLVLLTLPIAIAGSALAATAAGSVLSFASLAGFLTVLSMAVRNSLLLLDRYRDLRKNEGMEFGIEQILHGTRDRAAAILTSSIVTGAAVVPLVLFSQKPGFEILGPMALVVLGGLVTSTLYSLCVVPALYAWFGANVLTHEVFEDDALVIPVTGDQLALAHARSQAPPDAGL